MLKIKRDCCVAIALALAIVNLVGAPTAEAKTTSHSDLYLNSLKVKFVKWARSNPDAFDPVDVDRFANDEGAVAATRFMKQRHNDVKRAIRLTNSALRWRTKIGLNKLQASDFPCDLFELGLIFEHGRAHIQSSSGQFIQTNPVIWLRLGALGSLIKYLEKMNPIRLISYAYNAPRRALSGAAKKQRKRSNRRRQGAPFIKDRSVGNHDTVGHVLKSIVWWLNDWVDRHPAHAQATLVLDFENTDFAFASWSVGEFLIKLDDFFPNLFDRIIGFRYKAKLWSIHTPISMFNRIFKSRVASSPETDSKLRFVRSESQLSAYIPRVDVKGHTMLPEHVSGICVGPDESKAPKGCQRSGAATSGAGLYDPNFWAAIRNEFYHPCRAKPREVNN